MLSILQNNIFYTSVDLTKDEYHSFLFRQPDEDAEHPEATFGHERFRRTMWKYAYTEWSAAGKLVLDFLLYSSIREPSDDIARCRGIRPKLSGLRSSSSRCVFLPGPEK